MPDTPEKTAKETGLETALVVFTPSGKRGRFLRGTPLLECARKLGVDLDSVCGGRGICGRCQVNPAEGNFAKHGITSLKSHLSAFGKTEQRYKDKRGLKDDRRLACSTLLKGDVVIDVPADSQVHKQLVRKRPEVRDIRLDPTTKLYYVEVEKPTLDNAAGDLQRLLDAIEAQWNITNILCDFRTLQGLQDNLRRGEWKVTCAIYDSASATRPKLIAVWPGFHDRLFGVAIDVGSTTIACDLCDLRSGEVLASEGLMNPQIRFGEDLMSRVSYAMLNPGGDEEMTRAVRETVNALIGQVAAQAMLDISEILEAVFVGNPIMHHLLLGINPIDLGAAPFALASSSAQTLWASEIDIVLHPDARVYVLPLIAGHVGADTAGVLLSETPYLRDEISLIADVGTNAEILLGNKDRLFAASSPTGPAFEGAQISAGQRAAPGAIENVRIDRQTLEPKFKVIGCDLWSDEDGFKDALPAAGITGICGSGIIEALAELYLARVITADGVIDGKLADRTPRIQPDGRVFSYKLHEGEPQILVTQADVRAIQLAKAALYAGAQLLMDRMGVGEVDRIVLVGAFGSHIDLKYAMVLGLIPDCDLGKVSSAGNAAGTGARIALLNREARREVERRVQTIEKIETAIEPRFQEHFIEAMAFPHKTAPYTHLAKVVELPERTIDPFTEKGRRKRGRQRNR